MSPSIVKIVDKIRALLASAQEDTLVRSALQSLAAMSNTIVPGEESAITIVTPAVLGYVLEQASRVTALQTLLAFSYAGYSCSVAHVTLTRYSLAQNSDLVRYRTSKRLSARVSCAAGMHSVTGQVG